MDAISTKDNQIVYILQKKKKKERKKKKSKNIILPCNLSTYLYVIHW